jgi:hypothetical protein
MATASSAPSTPDSRPGLPLEERYNKLVEAYKKIKHQNGLLKQAVLQVPPPQFHLIWGPEQI